MGLTSVHDSAGASTPEATLVDPVCVFRSADPGRIALSKSILQSAGIPFLTLNEATLHLRWRRAACPVELLVAASEAEDARVMVRDLEGWTDAT